MPKCSTCTHEIPKTARTCPHCGFLMAPTARAKKQVLASIPPVPQHLPSMQQAPPTVQHPPNAQHPPNIQQFQQQQFQQTTGVYSQTREASPQGGGVPPQARGVQPYPQIAACSHHCPHRSFPPAGSSQGSSSDVSALSIASLVLGVIALLSSCMPFLGLPFGIGGIICGMACKDKKIKGTSMALAVTGIIFSILGLMLSLAMLVFWLTTPSFESFPSDQFIF